MLSLAAAGGLAQIASRQRPSRGARDAIAEREPDRRIAPGSSRSWVDSSSLQPPAPNADEQAAKVAAAVASWRNGILQKDTDTVVKLDLTFREAPDLYAGALADQAKSDADARVRAFSTRVLGKLGRGDLEDVFRDLLGDSSPYVRQNAAWAIGELAGSPTAQLAGGSTLASLRRAETRDPDRAVRSAARDALDRMNAARGE